MDFFGNIDWDNFLVTVGTVTTFFMVLPIVLGLMYAKYWNKPIKIAFIYCFATILVNIIENIFIWGVYNYEAVFLPFITYWQLENTFFLLILYYLKNFLLLGWFYSLIFPKAPYDDYIWKVSLFCIFVILTNYLFIEGYHDMGVLNPMLDTTFMVLLPLIYLWCSQKESLKVALKKNPYFWISLGLLIPNLIGVLHYLTGDISHESNFTIYVIFQTTKNLFEIIGQILIAIGFAHSYYARFIATESMPITITTLKQGI